MPNDTAAVPALASSTTRRTLAPTTYAEAFEFAQHLAKSSMVPAEYRGKPENILLAIQWGMEVGLAPLQAIQNIAVINGKPSVYGDALLAMVKGSPVCEDVIEGFEGEDESLTAVCEARRKGKAPAIVRFGVVDAKKAGLWGKTGPWQQYPRRMLQMRARGFALRDAFPDVLRGVITAEEAADYPVDVSQRREMMDVTPKRDLDQFASGGTTELPVVELARAEAAKGKEAFRSFLQSLSREEFDALKPLVGTREEPGELTRTATEADRAKERDPFGLPPARTEQPSEQAAPERRGEPRTEDAVSGSHAEPFAQRMAALVPQPLDLAGGEMDWRGYADAAIAAIGDATQAEASGYSTAGNEHLQRMRRESGDNYRRIMDAINRKGREAA